MTLQRFFKRKSTGHLLIQESFLSHAHDVLSPARMYVYVGGLLLVVCTMTTQSNIALYYLLVIVVLVYYFKRSHSRQLREFNQELPRVISRVASHLHAGLSLTQSAEVLARESVGVFPVVFQEITYRTLLGIPQDRALAITQERIKHRDWDKFIYALSQGQPSAHLVELQETLRAQEELRQHIHISTSSGKMTGFFIAILAPLGLLVFMLISPAYVSPLYTTSTGKLLLATAATLEVVGAVWIWRITQIEI